MSATTNLNAPFVVAGQNQKEVTLNSGMSRFDAAITANLALSVASGNVAPTQEEVRAAARLSITGATTSGRTVTWPAVQKPFYASLDAASTHPVTIVRGSASRTLWPGATLHLYSDGTTNSLVRLAEFGPYRIVSWLRGLPGNDEVVVRFKVWEGHVLLPDLRGWAETIADTAATATTVFDVRRNGTTVGTLTWSAAGTVPALATSGGAAQSFSAGDFFDIKGPATADATLSDIAFSIMLIRS